MEDSDKRLRHQVGDSSDDHSDDGADDDEHEESQGVVDYD